MSSFRTTQGALDVHTTIASHDTYRRKQGSDDVKGQALLRHVTSEMLLLVLFEAKLRNRRMEKMLSFFAQAIVSRYEHYGHDHS